MSGPCDCVTGMVTLPFPFSCYDREVVENQKTAGLECPRGGYWIEMQDGLGACEKVSRVEYSGRSVNDVLW